jgi:hypothetical protein
MLTATFSVSSGRRTAEVLDPEDKRNVTGSDRPSWPQEGWLRHKEKGP